MADSIHYSPSFGDGCTPTSGGPSYIPQLVRDNIHYGEITDSEPQSSHQGTKITLNPHRVEEREGGSDREMPRSENQVGLDLLPFDNCGACFMLIQHLALPSAFRSTRAWS